MTAPLRPSHMRPSHMRLGHMLPGLTRPGRIAAEALAFQSDLDRLVAEPPPRLLRLWPLFGAALLVALVAAAAVLRVDIVVVATGRLAADAPSVLLQPMSRAILRELLVRPGDVVMPGQVLARMDPTLPEADRVALAVEWRAVAAEIARLDAELAGKPVPGDGPDIALQAAVQVQRANLAAARRRELDAGYQALVQAAGLEAAAGPGLQERLAIAQEVEAMRIRLAARQSGSRLAVLEARAARLGAEAALGQHKARLSEIAQKRRASRAALAGFEIDLQRQMTEQVAKLRPRLAQLDELLAKANRLAALSDLIAPRAGVVLSVAVGGPGSMVTEGDAVVVLVPTDVPLVAEIGVRSSEVGNIAVGDTVSVKIDAFPWRRFGVTAGRLETVGSASYTPEGSREALHPARVALQSAPGMLAENMALRPGMTLTAEINTGTRSVLDYFLDPLMRGLRESLREP